MNTQNISSGSSSSSCCFSHYILHLYDVCSEKYTRFCQWKNLELNIKVCDSVLQRFNFFLLNIMALINIISLNIGLSIIFVYMQLAYYAS